MTTAPLISIVTPHRNGGRWLPLCLASVADQGVPQEHLVQDAGSTDGTLDWLPGDARVRAFVEKDVRRHQPRLPPRHRTAAGAFELR
jgi:GT2 family glycosyltransferase